MKWISVKDRLPSSDGNSPSESVLVYCTINGVRVGYLHQEKMKIQCGYCSEEMNITHWMTLPEVPNEVD
jgi:hypothetical protein